MPDFRDQVVRIDDCWAVRATEKAVLVRLPDGQQVWFPQSQIDDASEVWREGDEGTLVVSEWIAEQKELA